MTEPVGFVGPGVIGSRMVIRLLSAGVPVKVWARNPSKTSPLVAAGASSAETPEELTAGCSVILGCLLDDSAVRDVYPRLLAAARSGQIFVEHGTFSPTLARELSSAASAAGARFLDAPVTGGAEGADAGTLVIMAGGDAIDIDSVRPILSHYSSAVRHIGGPGTGLDLKLINQLLVSIHLGAVAEAAALLTRLAISPEVAVDVLNSGWAASAMLQRELPRALAREFVDTGATIDGLIHVQQIVADLFDALDIAPRLLPAARQQFADAVEAGKGTFDPAALITIYGAG